MKFNTIDIPEAKKIWRDFPYFSGITACLQHLLHFPHCSIGHRMLVWLSLETLEVNTCMTLNMSCHQASAPQWL